MKIVGILYDNQTRCIHYHSNKDIIAIKFKCCEIYYPCYFCHKEMQTHNILKWNRNDFNKKAILCGVCKNELTIYYYLNSNFKCPYCHSQFNENCRLHYHLYFEFA
jgi:uncharacterized CHY-type Zn-finger protein